MYIVRIPPQVHLIVQSHLSDLSVLEAWHHVSPHGRPNQYDTAIQGLCCDRLGLVVPYTNRNRGETAEQEAASHVFV